MTPDDLVNFAREEARAASYQRLQRSLPSADAHTTARARREYVNTQRGISTRIIESLQEKENNMTDQTSNHNTDDQEHGDKEQHPADRYPFPPHWPITGPFANNTDQE